MKIDIHYHESNRSFLQLINNVMVGVGPTMHLYTVPRIKPPQSDKDRSSNVFRVDVVLRCGYEGGTIDF